MESVNFVAIVVHLLAQRISVFITEKASGDIVDECNDIRASWEAQTVEALLYGAEEGRRRDEESRKRRENPRWFLNQLLRELDIINEGLESGRIRYTPNWKLRAQALERQVLEVEALMKEGTFRYQE